MIDNSANEASGSGNIAFNKVDEAVETSEITLKALDGKSVELSSGAEEIVINSAIEIANTSEIEAISGGIVLIVFVLERAIVKKVKKASYFLTFFFNIVY